LREDMCVETRIEDTSRLLRLWVTPGSSSYKINRCSSYGDNTSRHADEYGYRKGASSRWDRPYSYFDGCGMGQGPVGHGHGDRVAARCRWIGSSRNRHRHV